MPVPDGLERIQQWHDILWRFGQLRLHPRDFFLRFVSLNVAFEHDFARDGFGGFSICLVPERPGDDRFKVRDGGAGKPLADGVLDRFPQCLAGSGLNVLRQPERGKQD
jgi:hypothetical protein